MLLYFISLNHGENAAPTGKNFPGSKIVDLLSDHVVTFALEKADVARETSRVVPSKSWTIQLFIKWPPPQGAAIFVASRDELPRGTLIM